MTGKRRLPWIATAFAAALLAGGCSKHAPDGQVVARVNGDEITQSELNAEMSAAGVPPAQRVKAGPVVLQSIVARKLLAQAAAKEGIDKSPDYVLLRRRADEVLLAQRYLQGQMQKAAQQPGGDDIDDYLRTHPALAENRQLLTLDQIRFPSPTDAAQLRALQGTTTMAALIALLRSHKIDFAQNAVQADTATLPDNLIASINRLKPDEPLVIIGGPVLTAATVTGRQPIPTSPAQASAIAKHRMQAEAADNRMKQENAALRAAATIDYAKGMAPPAGMVSAAKH